MKTAAELVSLLALLGSYWLGWHLAAAHTVLTYPGWRGNNLITNDTFPHGMQWMYPCGGMGMSTNRTKWPVTGFGALAIQPGWFQGHATAFFYINMGFGNQPPNMSFPMLPVFQITGPSREMYNGTFCLPQVPLPANTTVNIGDNATIQVVEAAVHGAALFNCVDITFADPKDVAEVNKTNCFNSSTIGFNQVFTAPSASAGVRRWSTTATASLSSLLASPLALASFVSVLLPLVGII